MLAAIRMTRLYEGNTDVRTSKQTIIVKLTSQHKNRKSSRRKGRLTSRQINQQFKQRTVRLTDGGETEREIDWQTEELKKKGWIDRELVTQSKKSYVKGELHEGITFWTERGCTGLGGHSNFLVLLRL